MLSNNLEQIPILKKGGIHIKKKNRGKFTEYCGGKVTEECIAKGKKSKDPKIRKRATFAANARTWKHENGGILKAQEGTTEGFWSKLWNTVKEGGMAARDAKLGAVGARQVRDLYSEGKNQEAQNLAKQYAKANTTGIALAGGAASTGLLGDLMVTGATTAADTFIIDGDTENFGKNLVKNATGDLIGHGIFKGLKYFNGKPIFVKEMRNGIGDGLYHLDYGDAKGAFKSGSYVKNGYLYPGKANADGQLDYIWFNEFKPYATAVHGKPFSRTIIFEQKDVPGILRVREQNYPIGQWDGKSGFVTKHEMVTSNPVDMDNATIYKRIPAFNIWLRTK